MQYFISGIILYNGQKKDGTGDFISFGLSNGFPEFRFDVGSGPAVIKGAKELELGKWHTVKLNRERADGSMIVNDEGPYVGNIYGSFQGLDLLYEPLLLGGVPDFSSIHRLSGHSKGFVGRFNFFSHSSHNCISHLILYEWEWGEVRT